MHPVVFVPELRTERLLLRAWRDEDHERFAALNSDPRVMAHFPSILSRKESDDLIARFNTDFHLRGFGGWAVEAPGVTPFLGFVGLAIPRFTAHFTPCVEIGWRLAFEYWGKGYATEGARAVLSFGFSRVHLKEVLAFTVPANLMSRRVMEKLGMRTSPSDDFDHPKLPAGHPLRRHLLYRLSVADWEAWP